MRTFLLTVLIIVATSCKSQTKKMLSLTDENRPHIEVKINGKSAVFLVDTGATTSILDLRVAYNLADTVVKVDSAWVMGVSGVSNQIYETDSLGIYIHTKRYRMKFGAMDLTSQSFWFYKQHNMILSGILGSDFLRSTGATINLRTNKVKF